MLICYKTRVQLILPGEFITCEVTSDHTDRYTVHTDTTIQPGYVIHNIHSALIPRFSDNNPIVHYTLIVVKKLSMPYIKVYTDKNYLIRTITKQYPTFDIIIYIVCLKQVDYGCSY